jgi:iron-sulfur cluster assembly protein
MVTLTEAASRKLGEVLAQQAEHGRAWYGLRLSANGGCCSGPRYGIALAEAAAADDWVGEFAGVRVLVDPGSAPLLAGVRIDFVRTPEGDGFTIVNPDALPMAGGGCACGGHGA